MASNLVNAVLFRFSLGFWIFSTLFVTARLLLNNTSVLRRTHLEDVLMVIAFTFYSASIILIDVSDAYPLNISNNELEPLLSDSENLHQRVAGSVLVIATEQCMLFTAWAIKISVIAFLYRLSKLLPSTQLMLMLIASYISAGLIALEICFYAVLCTPFSEYWTLPVKNPQCASHSIFATTEMVFDISAILFIMAVAGFITYRSKLPLNRLIILLGLFCMSSFTIASAALKWVYKNGNPGTLTYSFWCIMELSTAIWIGNWIYLWPILQKFCDCRTFAYSFSHTIRNPNEGQEPLELDPSRVTTSWWSRIVQALKTRRAGNTIEQDVEMNSRTSTQAARARHAHSASRGTTILMHTELADYLEGDPITPHSQSLRRDEDTSPALIYREINKID